MTAKSTPGTYSRIAAERIRRMRLQRGLSTQHVANTMARRGFPIGRVAISQIENGYRRNVTIDEVVAFAALFGVPVTALLREDDVLCETCRDDPPEGFCCLACGSAWVGEAGHEAAG